MNFKKIFSLFFEIVFNKVLSWQIDFRNRNSNLKQNRTTCKPLYEKNIYVLFINICTPSMLRFIPQLCLKQSATKLFNGFRCTPDIIIIMLCQKISFNAQLSKAGI